MNKIFTLFPLLLLAVLIFTGCASKETVKETPLSIYEKSNIFKNDFAERNIGFQVPPGSKIDTLMIDTEKKIFEINFSREFSYIPFRKENVETIYEEIKNYFAEFDDYKFSLKTLDYPIEELIPNFYREKSGINYDRISKIDRQLEYPIVRNVDNKSIPLNGLQNRNILLWHSHGWYYSINSGRWEWQRPRLFQSVEDMIPMQFVLPYLIPMFENSGARVFVPRERDIQTNEVVVDNDSQSDIKNKNYIERSGGKNNLWKNGMGDAFAYGNPPYPVNFNPFKQGTHRIITSETDGTASAEWAADIPVSGNYSVYISYSSSHQNADDAQYIVHHAGGVTEFRVNQTVGGNTWIYLGNFKFVKGFEAKIVLTNNSRENGKIISADAVRFGGGMGIVEREGSTSGRPKYLEGARYWLQYAGMPDTLVYDLNKTKNDYNDDYQSRAEYGNYLMGAPFGPNRKRDEKGLGVPIDLSIAFHTDAGITRNDTTIGTLSIYSLEGADNKRDFPDGISRIANRDFADLIQTQITDDLRAKYDTVWNRRQLREAQYSESSRPNFPSVLLELLSHQNFLDMQYVLDPRFRFDVARAIYKASLKFLSVQNNFEYVVHPLPVNYFSTEFTNDGNIFLQWESQDDPLEPTAKPDRYIVYTRIDSGGFDNGTLVYSNQFVFNQAEEGKIYSFKVTAINNGGESFPSEILSACKINLSKNSALIINGFDRISAPAKINTEIFAGFINTIDAGVPDKFDLGFSGTQYNFDPKSDFISNDAPGWGASHADFETKIIAGNSFDFPYLHGKALKEAGVSFVSASDESVEENKIDIKKYNFIDLILGEEKTTHWQKPFADSINGIQFQTYTKKMQKEITEYLLGGGNIFVSGAYIASDIYNHGDSSDIKFLNDILKYKLDSDHASNLGESFPVNGYFTDSLKFSASLNDSIYAVESPDAINPVGGSEVLYRYIDNSFSAAVGYKKDYGVAALGFPFESIIDAEARVKFMKQILRYLNLAN